MSAQLMTIVYPIADLARAKQVYHALLGVDPKLDESYYVGFEVDGQNVGLDPAGHGRGMMGPVAYWHVEDIEESLRALREAGATQLQPVRDVGDGKLITTVGDPDGNVIGLIQPAD